MSLTRTEQEAHDRATQLLAATELVEGRGALARFTPQARMVARGLLEALQALEQERSARKAIQADRDRLLATRFPGAT